MPFDDRKWVSASRNGDVGGALLDLSVALTAIGGALEKLSAKSHVDISQELAKVRKVAESAFDEFKDLTGWTPDDH
jgi:hypothetical protein